MVQKYDNVTQEEMEAARAYPMEIVWSAEDKAFLASFPDVPRVRVHGSTRAEAAEQGDELIIAWYTAMKDAGEPLPPPTVLPRAAVGAP